MATADEYAAWIVKNQEKKGTPEFDTVAKAYQEAKGEQDWSGSSNQEDQSNALMRMIRNTPGSAIKFASGIANTVMHPLDTAKGVLDLGAGTLRNVTPDAVRSFIDQLDPNPQAGQQASQIATATGQGLKNRYGGLENVKQTVISDPVGAAADLSTVLGIGGALAPGRAGNLLATASKYTNPLSVIPPAVKAVGAIGKPLLGLTTGVGSENIGQAARSGYAGNSAFLENLRGNESMTDVLSKAKDALQTMRETRSGAYKAGIAETAADTTKINFGSIDQKLADVVDSLKVQGATGQKWKIGSDQVKTIKELEGVVTQWRIDQSLHTPTGLDALKQRLDAIYPESMKHAQAQRAVTTVRNAVKEAIVEQSPKYADTMASYESALNVEKEIERALSLGNKAAQDTTMRRLQSLSRNNVNTNYGNRLSLAKSLEQEGGQSLLPSIAGQAMNTWSARGLGGQLGNLTTLGVAGLHNPAVAALLPIQSPKFVGASLYGLGRATGVSGGVLGRLGVNPERARRLGLLGYELGQEN